MSSEDTRGGYVTVHKVGEAMGSEVRERRREMVMGELGEKRYSMQFFFIIRERKTND